MVAAQARTQKPNNIGCFGLSLEPLRQRSISLDDEVITPHGALFYMGSQLEDLCGDGLSAVSGSQLWFALRLHGQMRAKRPQKRSSGN